MFCDALSGSFSRTLLWIHANLAILDVTCLFLLCEVIDARISLSPNIKTIFLIAIKTNRAERVRDWYLLWLRWRGGGLGDVFSSNCWQRTSVNKKSSIILRHKENNIYTFVQEKSRSPYYSERSVLVKGHGRTTWYEFRFRLYRRRRITISRTPG